MKPFQSDTFTHDAHVMKLKTLIKADSNNELSYVYM